MVMIVSERSMGGQGNVGKQSIMVKHAQEASRDAGETQSTSVAKDASCPTKI